MNISPIETAIAKAGNTSALARSLGISHTAVRKWRLLGRPPAERVLEIERLTGISRYDLRPDVFGPAPAVAPSYWAELPDPPQGSDP